MGLVSSITMRVTRALTGVAKPMLRHSHGTIRRKRGIVLIKGVSSVGWFDFRLMQKRPEVTTDGVAVIT